MFTIQRADIRLESIHKELSKLNNKKTNIIILKKLHQLRYAGGKINKWKPAQCY